ncbi:Ferredoxin-type protein NapH [Burkholderiales bacterium]|nr:MAG: quinol dehydrogenase ferredoxin subunit NapH [Burkholderiales bacterium]CAG1009565.1 Ferredoxin-type protein NapH [Burkholderiales bacterium]
MSRGIGSEARATKGWLKTHQWLLARRVSQLGILALFLLGPLAGVWIVKGNLTFSYTLNLLPLTDPFVLAQSLLARHWPETKGLIGAGIVLAFYALVGGRVFCSWVCPMNPVSDAAAWLRERLGIRGGAHVSREARYWLLALALLLAAATGTLAWELVNPVSLLHRGLIFGLGATWALVLAIFLFDLFVMKDGWCGHLCPMGAFYGLVGKFSLLRVRATRRSACDDCLDCYQVCPEAQMIRPALKGVDGAGPTILSGQCSNCGRCIEVCAKDVFEFGLRRPLAATPTLPRVPRVSPATGKSL